MTFHSQQVFDRSSVCQHIANRDAFDEEHWYHKPAVPVTNKAVDSIPFRQMILEYLQFCFSMMRPKSMSAK
ncbi:MAG: hypothetical protein IPG90_04735 [Bacteroidetes bacterium]|nr:hypothetical protein [Bacteroidota bacterium]